MNNCSSVPHYPDAFGIKSGDATEWTEVEKTNRADHARGRGTATHCRGCPSKQIAAELSISIKTVEKHRQYVMNKLNIHHIAGLTRYAIANGVSRLENGLEPSNSVVQ